MTMRLVFLCVLTAVLGCNNAATEDDEAAASEVDAPPSELVTSTQPTTLALATTSAAPSADVRKGGVAIVDLDDVLKQLQLKETFEATVVQRREESRKQLAALLIKLRDQYEAKKKSYGEQPDTAQAKELQSIYDLINRTYAEARTKADAALTAYQAKYIQDFRNRVAPIARRIALDRGLSIVITKNPTHILWFDPALDLTDQVVEALRDQQDRQ